MKHIFGKWEVDLSDTNGHGGWTIKTESHNIATVYANIVKSPRKDGDMAKLEDNQESIANALLIASCPELLKALEEVIKWTETGTPVNLIKELDVVIKKVKQAIAKAEGK